VLTRDGVRPADIVIDAGRITAIEQPGAAAGHALVDVADCWVLPGFIDVHVHGGGGAQFNTWDPAEVQRAAAFHARHGTTALVATTVAAGVDALTRALEAIRTVAASPAPGAAEVLGAHLEGPFLSRRLPGAMEPRHFMAPNTDVARQLLAGGGVRLLTLAPEQPGALEVIRLATEAGVVVSLGHTAATYAEATAAVAAGARSATHTFNAMRPLHHREPGVLGAVLDDERVTCEVICDGVHVAAPVVRLLQRLKGPERTMLVTDAIEATGLADGTYRLGDRAVTVAAGRATLPDSDTIAGSTLTMERALAVLVRHCGVSVPDAAAMASTTPATLLGIEDRKGSIAAERDADLVILDPDLALIGVLVRGVWARQVDATPCGGRRKGST
jgi:N-acetylglucosamine-6-phosphate deacetylase